jgi:hypothetical protein
MLGMGVLLALGAERLLFHPSAEEPVAAQATSPGAENLAGADVKRPGQAPSREAPTSGTGETAAEPVPGEADEAAAPGRDVKPLSHEAKSDSQLDSEPTETEPAETEPATTAPAKTEPTETQPSAKPEESPEAPPFDRAAARAALASAAGAASGCGKGEGTGVVQVSVTFANSGRVTASNVSGAYAGTPTGSCVARAMRSATVPAYSGTRITVSKRITIQ